MTYTYSDGSNTITNVYSARDSYAIANYMAKFTPSIVKRETSSHEQHKAFVNVGMMHNPLNINSALVKAAGIR